MSSSLPPLLSTLKSHSPAPFIEPTETAFPCMLVQSSSLNKKKVEPATLA